MEQGVERTALADVVKRSGGSLATLYKLFGNKAGLLDAVMLTRVEQRSAGLVENAATAPSPQEVLLRLALDLRHRAVDPTEVALARMIIAASIEDPDFAGRYYRKTILEVRGQLEQLFEGWRNEGQPLTAEPALLAAMFLGMFLYEVHSQAISHGTIYEGDDDCLTRKVAFFCQAAGLR